MRNAVFSSPSDPDRDDLAVLAPYVSLSSALSLTDEASPDTLVELTAEMIERSSQSPLGSRRRRMPIRYLHLAAIGESDPGRSVMSPRFCGRVPRGRPLG
jgi:hypothetical protein